jgi:ABC-type nitrate/sulfonate/bicarbonate transport system ATPase subunit
MTKLEVLNLSHTFVQNNMRLPVLNNLHFSVGTGQFIALLGPSGCGKSTLFNIISGLLIPQDGAIYLNGNPILGRTGVFGYMQQKDLLLQWRTVLNNVLIGPEIQKEPLEPARKEALLLADKIYVLTSRPASIKAEIDVSLPRPRCITDTELISLKSDLFETLMVEMQQVFNSD